MVVLVSSRSLQVQCIEFLKAHAARSLPGSAMEDDEHEYRSMERCVLLMSRLHSDLDADTYLRAARELIGKAQALGDSASTRRPFQDFASEEPPNCSNVIVHSASKHLKHKVADS
eukprot:6492704-Amphidinium_carterae.3